MNAVKTAAGIDLRAHLLLELRTPDDIDDPSYLSLPPVSEEFPDVFVTNDTVPNWDRAHGWTVSIDLDWFAADFEDIERLAVVLKATALQARILNASEAFGVPLAEVTGDIIEPFEAVGEIEIGGVVYVVYVSKAD
jgi:hypothetical protein